MKRVCFLLRVKKGKLKEYLAAHRVWPEMLSAIRASGIRNYSLFARKDGMLVGYFEARNPEKALRALSRTDVNRRWQEFMAPFFGSGSGDLKNSPVEWLEQYFYTA